MHLTNWIPIVALLSLLMIAGVPAVAADEETAEPETGATDLALPGPVCGAASPASWAVETDGTSETDPEPQDICNCNPENEEADCKRVCGEAGGSCLVTIPCEDPSKYSGWCYCNDRNATPNG